MNIWYQRNYTPTLHKDRNRMRDIGLNILIRRFIILLPYLYPGIIIIPIGHRKKGVDVYFIWVQNRCHHEISSYHKLIINILHVQEYWVIIFIIVKNWLKNLLSLSLLYYFFYWSWGWSWGWGWFEFTYLSNWDVKTYLEKVYLNPNIWVYYFYRNGDVIIWIYEPASLDRMKNG